MWPLLLILFVQSANADDVKIGQEYYRLRCAECHGGVGEGGRGPNLAAGVFYHGGEDQDVFDTIRNGIRGTEMPGFGSSDERLWQVVAFIRSLNLAATPEEASGDATRGEALFQGKGDCLSCHRVGLEGGFSGPDLGSIGSRRSLEHLRTSMFDPNDREASLLARYRHRRGRRTHFGKRFERRSALASSARSQRDVALVPQGDTRNDRTRSQLDDAVVRRRI